MIPKTYTLTLSVSEIADLLSALASACDNADHFARADEDDAEVCESWRADERILSALHDAVEAASRQIGGAK